MMKDYLLNCKDRMDPVWQQKINCGRYDFLFPCSWIRFNRKVKLAFFPDGYTAVGSLKKELDLEGACAAGKLFLDAIAEAQSYKEFAPDNFVLDLDSIYLSNDRTRVKLIYLPVVVREAPDDREIFVRRVYAVLTELFQGIEGGSTMIRQIEYQMSRQMGDFASLKETLDKRIPVEDGSIVLRSLDPEQGSVFEIGHEVMRIGKDPDAADGVITQDETVEAVHAEIGWNDISFYVKDLGSEYGTFVNDTRIAPDMPVPIGKGSIVRFGNFAFRVE